jgi:hypothetical protein
MKTPAERKLAKAKCTKGFHDRRRAAKICMQCGSSELVSDVLCAPCLEQRRVRSKAAVKERKTLILSKYGKVCACCGESHEEFLTLDHPNNDGAAHRKELGVSSGSAFYSWIIKNGFPPGFQTLCWNCNCAKSRFGYCPHTQFPNFVGDWEMATQQYAN